MGWLIARSVRQRYLLSAGIAPDYREAWRAAPPSRNRLKPKCAWCAAGPSATGAGGRGGGFGMRFATAPRRAGSGGARYEITATEPCRTEPLALSKREVSPINGRDPAPGPLGAGVPGASRRLVSIAKNPAFRHRATQRQSVIRMVTA
jgi:hypothetical protein